MPRKLGFTKLGLKAGMPTKLVPQMCRKSRLPKCAQKGHVPRKLVQKHYAAQKDEPMMSYSLPHLSGAFNFLPVSLPSEGYGRQPDILCHPSQREPE